MAQALPTANRTTLLGLSGYHWLVIAAVLTSQIAGAWLDYVLRRGWPLLAAGAAAGIEASAGQQGLSSV